MLDSLRDSLTYFYTLTSGVYEHMGDKDERLLEDLRPWLKNFPKSTFCYLCRPLKGSGMEIFMKMKLPISWPITETYQSSSFVMSIIRAHDNIKHVYENNYINLVCHDTSYIWDIGLSFWDVTWDDLRKRGVFEMDLFYVDNFSSETLPSFWRERIDQGNYLLLHMIDEYYMPYTKFYRKRHYIHDTYIYGYEEEFFLIMAYSEGKLKELKVSSTNIVQSIFSAKEYKSEVYFCSLRPNKSITVTVDYQQIKRNIYIYLGCDNFPIENTKQCINMFNVAYVPPKYEEGYVYGNSIYDILINCLLKIVVSNANAIQIDIRPFRLLWEHKCIICEKIKQIITRYSLSIDILLPFEDLISLANQIFMLSIKYSVVMQKKIVKRMIDYIKELKKNEEMLLYDFLTLWEKS